MTDYTDGPDGPRFVYDRLCEPSNPEDSFQFQIENLTTYPIPLPHDYPHPYLANDGHTIRVSPTLSIRICPQGDPRLILARTDDDGLIITIHPREIHALVEGLANAAGLLAVRAARQED